MFLDGSKDVSRNRGVLTGYCLGTKSGGTSLIQCGCARLAQGRKQTPLAETKEEVGPGQPRSESPGPGAAGSPTKLRVDQAGITCLDASPPPIQCGCACKLRPDLRWHQVRCKWTLLCFCQQLRDSLLDLVRRQRGQELPEEVEPLFDIDLAVSVFVKLLEELSGFVFGELGVEDLPGLRTARLQPTMLMVASGTAACATVRSEVAACRQACMHASNACKQCMHECLHACVLTVLACMRACMRRSASAVRIAAIASRRA
jgi:hypothetical protein